MQVNKHTKKKIIKSICKFTKSDLCKRYKYIIKNIIIPKDKYHHVPFIHNFINKNHSCINLNLFLLCSDYINKKINNNIKLNPLTLIASGSDNLIYSTNLKYIFRISKLSNNIIRLFLYKDYKTIIKKKLHNK